MKDFNTNTANNPTWLTPPEIIQSLGQFDLDPCSPVDRPWDTASNHLTIHDDGLLSPWSGRVWMNPPYGRELGRWLEKLSMHQNGTALIFARTETEAFQRYVFSTASSILFMKGRVRFYDINGNQGMNANAPSVLIGYDEYNSEMIEQSGLSGHHLSLHGEVFMVGISTDQPWRIIVGKSIAELGGEAELSQIYDAVLKMAPNRVRKNRHYKAKVRQQLQFFYDKVDGKWTESGRKTDY